VLRELTALVRWDLREVRDFEEARATMMRQAFVFVGATAVLVLPLLALLGEWLQAGFPVSLVVASVLGLSLLRSGRHQLAAWTMLSVWMVCATLSVGLTNAVPGPAGMFFVPGVAASVLWLRTPGAVVMIALHAAVLGLADTLYAISPVHIDVPATTVLTLSTTSAILAVGSCAMLAGNAVQVLARVHTDAQVRALEARAAAAHARKASEAKAAFLASMSHELRTPLTAILGYTEMLREESPRDDEDFDRMHAAGSELLTLVDGVLEVARSEASPSAEEPTEVDLIEIIRSSKDSVSRYAPTFELEVKAPDERVLIRTHEHRLRRVVTQLLVHSAHSLGGGRIEVGVGTLDDGVQIAFPARSETGLAIAVAQRLAESIDGIVTAPTSPPATVGILTLFLDVEVVA